VARSRRSSGSSESGGSVEQRSHEEQRDNLRGISENDDGAIADLVAIRVREAVSDSDLDPKTFALVNIAALVANGGDEASYVLQVTAALDAGASVDEVTAVLTAVGPNVGVFKMVAAADPLAAALGINLVADSDDDDGDGDAS
jgi:4-carboxymuconolactone decarboxylase